MRRNIPVADGKGLNQVISKTCEEYTYVTGLLRRERQNEVLFITSRYFRVSSSETFQTAAVELSKL
jgi:hypothetical protein